jgi:SAM-dependent methyltransferase
MTHGYLSFMEIGRKLKLDMQEVKACPICGCTTLKMFYHPFLRCKGCGVQVQQWIPTADACAAFYKGSYRQIINGEEEPTPEMVRPEAVRAAAALPVAYLGNKNPKRHLDVGAGVGETMRIAQEVYHVVSDGVEPHDNFRRAIQAKGFTVYEHVSEAPDGEYDWATTLHVLEHVVDPVGFLKGIKPKLAAGGVLVVQVPNRGYIGAHLFSFFKGPLQGVIERAGFKMVDVALEMDSTGWTALCRPT